LVAVTVAPTRMAPLGSVTSPVISPKVWPKRGIVNRATKLHNMDLLVDIDFMR
jgi:hypothetical protein